MTKTKLVIWDLDNTLWEGTVYYQDKDSVRLKLGTAAALKELDKRGIKKLIEKFNVTPSEVIFVDDDAFQRAEVISQIPELLSIELKDPLDILELRGVQPENATDTDKKRVQILKEQRNREEAEKNHKGNYKEFPLWFFSASS